MDLLLEAEAKLQALVLDTVPDSIKLQHLREQSIGEVRGLRHLRLLVASTLEDLKQRVDEINKRAESQAVTQVDEASNPEPEFLANS